jgi:DNA-binding transcriptional regulator of glucitol operon
VFSSCLNSNHFALGLTDQDNSTTLKLQEAKNAVEQAFNAVLDAEKAGANVADQLTMLNDAVDLLAQADNSYRTGDNATTIEKANAVFPIAEQVTTDAQNLQEAFLASTQTNFWSTIIYSVIVAIAFVLTLFLVWRHLKRSYFKNLPEVKPEVNSQ